MKKTLLFFLLTIGIFEHTNAQNFIKETTIENGSGTMNIIDFDGDDSLDLLFTNTLGTTHFEWANDTFTRVRYPSQLPNEYLPFANPGTFSFEDYDGDGDMDVLMIGKTSFSIFDLNPYDRSFILKNNNGRFEPIEVTNEIEPVRRKWFDYDFDGDLDLLQSLDKIYQNTGSSYELTDDIIESPSNRKFLYIDLDNDSDKDLIISGEFEGLIYENIESRFFLKDSTSIPPIKNSTLAVGDVNNDGFNDIVVGGIYTDPLQEYTAVKAFWNDGFGNFSLSDTIYDPIDDGPFSFTFPEGLRIQDIDSDGSNDIYVKTERPFYVFRTTDNSEIQIDIDQQSFNLFGDINHDGKLDIWNTPDNEQVVYKNNFPGTNNAPQPPTNIQISNDGAITYFNWSTGTDDKNPPHTLTYNVKIGTTSGGSEMLSCNSNANGKRQQYTPGNSGFGTFHKIKNLPAGNYFFSIQSIDGSYIGSEFVTVPFTVNPPLAEPKLVAPANRFKPLPIRSEFRWEAVANAEDYNIQVATDPKFENIVIDKSNIVTVFDTLVLPDCHTEYFWRVRGEAIGFESAWSYIFSLHTCPVYSNIDTLGASTLNEIHLMEFVDIDNDGDPDLAALHASYGLNVQTYEANFYKNENGVFTHFSTAERVSHVNDSRNLRVLWSWADRDLDGDYDFYITGLRFQESLFFENDGTGVFTRDSLLDFPAGAEIQWFDAENDNLPDAIIPFGDQFNVLVRQNNFAPLGVSGRGGDRMEPVDVNNDGRVDIVTLTQGVIFNNGNLNFVENTLSPFEPVSKGDIAVADVDGNGFMDIFGSGVETGFNNTRRFYFNNQGFFTPAIDLPKGTVRDAYFTDFNVDGKPDLAYTGINSGIILRNEEGNLNPFIDFGDNINAIAFTDFDNDGDEDMAYAFAGSNSIFLGVNNEGSENAAPFFRPAPPTGLNADVQGQSVLLSFIPEVRRLAGEQTTGSSYNFVVGTSPNDASIVSPIANLSTGFNYLPKKGNVGYANDYLLQNLQPGEYFWSVQTIAANGSSSEFAAWERFIVGSSMAEEVSLKNNFLLFPNPVKDRVFIKFHKPTAKHTEGVIFNHLGQMTETFEIEKGLESIIFNPSNLRPGVYLLKINEMVGAFIRI